MMEPDERPPVLRQISVRRVMDVLLQEGATSRAALAKKTGLSKQTMSDVIRTLEDAGWVKPTGMISGKLGRSAIAYDLAEDAAYAIGIELGVNVMRLALVSITGRILHESVHETKGWAGEALIAHMQHLVDAALVESGISKAKVLLGAVAMPGVIEPRSGRLMLAANMGETGGLDIVSRLGEALGCRVVVENDVNAAALGESWKGCSAGLSSSVFASLGTGVGLGVLIDGRLLKGAQGMAGEIAYLPLGADPYAEESLERGALETAIGESAILARFNRTGTGDGSLTLAEILRLADQGEEPALSVLGETARLAALMILSIDAMLDPEMIVLGGPIGAEPLMVRLVQAELRLLTRRTPVLQTSRLGTRATLVGIIGIALNQLHTLLFSPQDLPKDMRLPAMPR